MKNSSITLSLFLLVFFAISCEKKPEFQPGVFVDSETVIIETDVISASYQVNEQEVKLIIEDLLNTSDNRADVFPMLDFLSVEVDMNNNNLPDNNVDKSYSISSGGTNCMQYVLQEGNAGTGCIEEEGYSYSIEFRTSDKSSAEHIIYEYIINKENVFTISDTVGLVFTMRGDDSGGSIPSMEFPTFGDTIEFSL